MNAPPVSTGKISSKDLNMLMDAIDGDVLKAAEAAPWRHGHGLLIIKLIKLQGEALALGADDAEIKKMQLEFLRKPGRRQFYDVLRRTVVRVRGLPPVAADSGLSAAELLQVEGALTMHGDMNGSAAQDPRTWITIKNKGFKAGLEEACKGVVGKGFGIPANVLGKRGYGEIMKGLETAQLAGYDEFIGDAAFWNDMKNMSGAKFRSKWDEKVNEERHKEQQQRYQRIRAAAARMRAAMAQAKQRQKEQADRRIVAKPKKRPRGVVIIDSPRFLIDKERVEFEDGTTWTLRYYDDGLTQITIRDKEGNIVAEGESKGYIQCSRNPNTPVVFPAELGCPGEGSIRRGSKVH